MVDGRGAEVPRFCREDSSHALCLVHDVDMIAVLKESERADFVLECHGFRSVDAASNALDSASSILPYAARSAVAFADLLGVKPFHSTDYTFEYDGLLLHATIESHLGECKVVALLNSICSSPSAFTSESLPVICEGEL